MNCANCGCELTTVDFIVCRRCEYVEGLKALETKVTDKQRRDAAVDAFAAAMKARLDEKAAQGYSGWDGEYPTVDLCDEIAGAAVLLAGSPDQPQKAVDIGNRAMMLWYRTGQEAPGR